MSIMPEPKTTTEPVSEICIIDAENFCSTHQGIHPVDEEPTCGHPACQPGGDLYGTPHAVPAKPDTRIGDGEVRRFAARLDELGFAINPDGDPSYLVERINALLAEGVTPTPPESEWAPPPACPSWCTGRHDDDGQFRDCSSEEMFVPQYRDGVACVDVGTTFNRATGLSTPVLVRVEDYSFNSKYARHLARLLVQAADLADDPCATCDRCGELAPADPDVPCPRCA